jgi:hypothetical protein
MAVLSLGQMIVAVRLAQDVLSNPTAKLSAASQVLGVLGLVLAQLYVVGHILLTLLRPQQALRRRKFQATSAELQESICQCSVYT